MWNKIKSSNLFLSFTQNYEFFITDYVTLWYTFLTKTNFIRSLKDKNFLLEMSDDALLQKGIQVLSNPGSLKDVDVKIEGNNLLINMTMIFGYPFKVNLKLSESSKELFFQKLIQPLVKTISELKSSQTELCRLLKKKDSEIEEYKCEGGEIALKHLKTKPFDETKFLSQYQCYEKQFGLTDEIVNDIIQVKLKVPEDLSIVKNETEQNTNNLDVNTLKMEPDSTLNSIKIEPNTVESLSQQNVSATVNIKQEQAFPIKRESENSMVNGRRKIKKLNL